LTQKKERLLQIETELNDREQTISQREGRLRKYYLVPRPFVDLPVTIALLVGVYFGWQAISGIIESTESSNTNTPPSAQISSPESTVLPSLKSCLANGIAYYKEIGSYPMLSTGEDARKKVEGMCRRSNGGAFRK